VDEGKKGSAHPNLAQDVLASLSFTASDTDSPFDAWRSLLGVLFDVLAPKNRTSGSFEASFTVHHLGTFLLCRSIADGGRYGRTEARLNWDEYDHIVVSCVVSGGIALAGSSKRLRPGDVAVFDLSAPVSFATTAVEALHLVVPRIALPASVAPMHAASCRILRRDSAMGILLRRILEALAEAARRFHPVEVVALEASLPDLLASCLGPAAAVLSTGDKGNLGRRLRRHIEENLHRGNLTPSDLARDFGMSRSQLFRQFESSGGIETYIRRRRLRRALHRLCDPRHANRRIGEIAYEIGFSDEAHFSRLFSRTFGQSPRSVRASARQGGSGPLFPKSEGASFGGWLGELGSQ